MARLSGYVPGLVPRQEAVLAQLPDKKAKAKLPKPPRRPKDKKAVVWTEVYCEGCNAFAGWSNEQEPLEPYCHACNMFFGVGRRGYLMGHGTTNMTVQDAKDRILQIRETQWGLCLIHNTFGAHNGESVELERGDVYRIVRAGNLADEAGTISSTARTFSMYSVEVALGPHRVTLFPHEISPINFLKLMEYKQAGEMEECYLSGDDTEGFFMPTPEVARQIEIAYGGRNLDR